MRPALGVSLLVAAAAIAIVLWPGNSKNPARRQTAAERDPRPAHPLDGDGERVRVYGTVTAGGKPLAGATVQLHGGVRARHPPVARATTAADGSFDLGDNTLGEWSLVALAGGHQAVALGRRPSPVRFELSPCRYPLRGHIRDSAGAAVRGAYLTQEHPDRTWAADEHGAFEVCVDPRAPRFRVAAPHHVDGGLDPRPTDRELDVVLLRRPTIVGRVVRDDTGEPLAGLPVGYPAGVTTASDGSFRIEDAFIGQQDISAGNEDWYATSDRFELRAGETLRLTLRAHHVFWVRGVVLEASGEPVRSSAVGLSDDWPATDDEGRFTMPVVKPGERVVRVHNRVSATPSRVTLSAGGPALVIHAGPLQPPPPGSPDSPPSARGRVTRLGVPVAGAEILNSHGYSLRRSDDDGTFEYWPDDAIAGAFSRELLAATSKPRIGADGCMELQLDEAAAIGGIVVDHRGHPVGKVGVRVHDPATGFATVVYNRADGGFYIGALPPGTYEPSVFRGDARPFALEPVAPIHVPTGDAIVTQVRLVIDTRTAPIAGRVVDSSGAPVAGAHVSLQGLDRLDCDGWQAELLPLTGPDGRFRMDDLPVHGKVDLFAVTCDRRRGELRGAVVGNEDLVLRVVAP